jgi:TolB-like protein/Tfp pilus assembly protein PilF
VSLIVELKRRSVFKVGAAYLVVGWLVVQAASIALPAFEAPAWALRAFILFVLLGFPIALVLAWSFDITPEGVKLDPTGVGTKRMFTAAAILAALAVGWFMRGGVPGSSDFDAPLGPQSTAVLPFVNMSSDKENEYFSDGLTETLLHKLAQVPQLKVAARTSSFAFKGKQQDIRSIGRELGVATVMEGSVQRAGDTLRITAQLVRTADGSHLWSRNYDRKLADLFAIQDEIAGAVAEALIGALVPEAKAAIAKGGTTDVAVYDLYTKALSLRNINSFESLAEADGLLKQVLERDPKFVDAMLLQANTWIGMANTGMIRRPEALARMAPVLDRVDALDPGNATVLAYRAGMASWRGDLDTARTLYERALAAAPQDAITLLFYASFLGGDNPDERVKALALLERAAAVDPLNPLVYTVKVNVLLDPDRLDAALLDEADKAARHAVTVAPNNPYAYQQVGQVALRRGDLASAFVWWRKSQVLDPTDHELAAELAGYLFELGQPAAADAWIAKSLAVTPDNFYAHSYQVRMHYERGDDAAALALAETLIGRHAESRRDNWEAAVSDGCYAAQRLGKGDAFRAALAQAGMLPTGVTEQAVKAMATGEVSARHLMVHLEWLGACASADGGRDLARRAQLLATNEALLGKDWAADNEYTRLYAAWMANDREALIANALALNPIDFREPRAREDYLRGFGVADDPRIKADLAARLARRAENASRLLPLVAQEKVSLLP